MTRKLGFRYIWIDSLCIIQDDAADWQVEAADMGRIYASAHLTIAATSSQSTHDGFLRRDGSASELVTMPYHAHDDPDVKGEFYLDPRSRSQARDIVSSNWNRRGWTFQERLLSARVLHFCQERICFECRGCDVTEDNQAPHVSQQAIWLNPDPGRPKQWMSILEDEEPYRTYRIYYSMIQRYTEREFTFQTDLQPAILGLVKEMKRTIDDECIWGIWRGGFHRGLLWCRHNLDSNPEKADYLTRPSEKRAPSWSWISVNGSVSWNITRHKYNSQTQFGLKILEDSMVQTSPPSALKVEARLVKLSSCEERFSWDQTVQLYWDDQKVGHGWSDVREPQLIGRRDIWLLEVEIENKGMDGDENLAALLVEESGDHTDSLSRVGFAVVVNTPFLQTRPRTIFLI